LEEGTLPPCQKVNIYEVICILSLELVSEERYNPNMFS
jgi:hypothetical protein